MSFPQTPQEVSYDTLLQALFQRSISTLSEEELTYFIDLVQSLRDLKDKTDTESWWFRYYK